MFQPGKPLRGFTFVLVGRAPQKITHGDLSRIIERCGGRVLHGALPDARLPMKCICLTQQSECSKSHDKVLATIAEACRREWEVLSYAFVVDAERSGTTPEMEGYKLNLINIRQAPRTAVVHATQLTSDEINHSNDPSAFCLLKKALSSKNKENQTATSSAANQRSVCRQIIQEPPKRPVHGYNMFVQEKYAGTVSLFCSYQMIVILQVNLSTIINCIIPRCIYLLYSYRHAYSSKHDCIWIQ